MSHFRMCTDKVRFNTPVEAFGEMCLQATHRPHWAWSYYDCLWCDFLHIGRRGTAPGHDAGCVLACERRNRQSRELRILEGTW